MASMSQFYSGHKPSFRKLPVSSKPGTEGERSFSNFGRTHTYGDGGDFIKTSQSLSQAASNSLSPGSFHRRVPAKDVTKKLTPAPYRGLCSNYQATMAPEQLANNTNERASAPSWLRPQVFSEPVVSSTMGESSYSTDMGKFGTVPAKRPIMMRGNIMATTTLDLQLGSSKTSSYLPGYGGHIPSTGYYQASQRVATKETIQETYRCNVEGYTGHEPKMGEGAGRAISYPMNLTTSGNSFKTIRPSNNA